MNCNHRIRVVKDNVGVYYTICVKCGQRDYHLRNQKAIVDMAWIKNIKHINGYVKIPYNVNSSR
jgi:hypothetical protein